MDLDSLYQEIILDHYKSPRNHRLLEAPDLKAEGFNPFCGDQVIFTAQVDGDGRIGQVGLTGQGCAISQASASMMAVLASGKSLGELEELAELFRSMMRGERSLDGIAEELGDLKALEVVRMYPVRIKCALLPWVALEEGIASFRKHSE